VVTSLPSPLLRGNFAEHRHTSQAPRAMENSDAPLRPSVQGFSMTSNEAWKRFSRPDVAVVGGGMAGIAAAVGAVRQGASVLLVEKYGFFGGMAYAAMVGTLCGLFFRKKGGIKWAVEGFAREFSSELAARCEQAPLIYKEGLVFFAYDPFILQELLLELVAKEDIDCLLHAQLVGVTISSKGDLELTVLVSGGSLTIAPRCVIDCTGQSSVSQYAGLNVYSEEEYQAGALVFSLNGLPDVTSESLQFLFMREILKGVEAREIDKECMRTSLIPGTLRNDRAFFKLGMHCQYRHAADAQTEYERTARRRICELVTFLKQAHPDLRNIYVSCVAPQVGIRSSVLPVGKGRLGTGDVMKCRKCDDGIARGTWPIEYWGQALRPEMMYFAENDYYEIPVGTLQSRYNDRLFFAGRNISASERALASARVIGTCLQTGYAAGTLASFKAKSRHQSEAMELIRHQQMGKTDV